LRDVWIRTQSTAVASWRATDLATHPPIHNHILALLNYDENSEKFVPSYHADVLLPYNDVLSLNNVLEFYITDANRKPVLVKDMSQLFISIQFL
jgi:hypothetical protein